MTRKLPTLASLEDSGLEDRSQLLPNAAALDACASGDRGRDVTD